MMTSISCVFLPLELKHPEGRDFVAGLIHCGVPGAGMVPGTNQVLSKHLLDEQLDLLEDGD